MKIVEIAFIACVCIALSQMQFAICCDANLGQMMVNAWDELFFDYLIKCVIFHSKRKKNLFCPHKCAVVLD